MRSDRRKVRITLESVQDSEVTVHHYEGFLIKKERYVYLQYDETEAGAATVNTTVRWNRQELKIIRRGDVDSEQTFIPGLRQKGEYRTPEMRFALETVTDELIIEGDSIDNMPLLIQWSYTLWMESQHVGRFQIRLQVQEGEH
ncbi:DUF1934 domain-containing protein [Paenibacillaceae bacterium]|nr:DUF1934 domain-containing protein [Paenibacillaceae bacterium]